jgi:PIN domain nuclease of toxin-antitoxin system
MIILDTHAWIWWVAESKSLSEKAGRAIAGADVLGVSIISCWEVAMLVTKRRLALRLDVHDWVGEALKRPKVRLLHLEPKTAIDSVCLPATAPDDPVDRILIAECRHHGASLVSKDAQIKESRLVEIVW